MMTRRSRAIALVVLGLSLCVARQVDCATPPGDTLSVDLSVDAIRPDAAVTDQSDNWAATLGSDSKGRVGAAVPPHEQRDPIVRRQTYAVPLNDPRPEAKVQQHKMVQALAKRGLRVRAAFEHVVRIPTHSGDDTTDILATLTSLPPLAVANDRVVSLLLDVDADGRQQMASVLGNGGAALVNASVRMCTGDPKWSSGECSAPGLHFAACAAHRDDDEPRTAKIREREYDAGFRVGSFGRAVSDLVGAWPLEYAWVPPEGRASPARCSVRDAMCGAVPLYRRLAVTALTHPQPQGVHHSYIDPSAGHCFIGQSLSPYAPCSNTILAAFDAAMPPETVDGVDVESDLCVIAAAGGHDCKRSSPTAAQNASDAIAALLLKPLQTVKTVDPTSAQAFAGQPTKLDRDGVNSGGTAHDRMNHANRATWSSRGKARRVAAIDAAEALIAKAEFLSVGFDVDRSRSLTGDAVVLTARVTLEAVFTGAAEAEAYTTALKAQLKQARHHAAVAGMARHGASPSFTVRAGPRSCELLPRDSSRTPGTESDAAALETACEDVETELGRALKAVIPDAPAQVDPESNQRLPSTGDITTEEQSDVEVPPLRVAALVESRGEHRGRLRSRITVPLTPAKALPTFMDEEHGHLPVRPVVGALDLAIRFPELLGTLHLQSARLAAVGGRIPLGDDAYEAGGNFSSLAHPCLAEPILMGSSLTEPSGIAHTHLRIPIISTMACREHLLQMPGGADETRRIDLDVLVDFQYAHLHADEYAPDMNRYYALPVALLRHTALREPCDYLPRQPVPNLYGHFAAGVSASALPMAIDRPLGAWLDANVANAVKRDAVPMDHRPIAVVEGCGRNTIVTQWAVSSHRGLATSPPIPDRAMPFNALAFWGTVLALAVMNAFNIAIRGGVPIAVSDPAKAREIEAEVIEDYAAQQ